MLPPYELIEDKIKALYEAIRTYSGSVDPGTGTGTDPEPEPTPEPTPTPVQYKNIKMGVNVHEGRAVYTAETLEKRLDLLAANNLRHIRTDVSTGYLDNTTEMNRLINLCVAKGIELRPMIYPCTDAQAYKYAKLYGDRVKVWEIGNEVNLQGKSGAEARVDALVVTYKAMKRASDELGLGLKFTANVTACNSDYAGATCAGDKTGDTWFLEMCRSRGFIFDYVSFHYYPYKGEIGYWYDLYLNQLVGFAKKYGQKVFLNEINCAEIYQGKTGNEQECVDSLRQTLTELNSKYRDYIAEITLYELVDEPYQGGAEGNFGLRKDLDTPKAIWNVVTEFALAKVGDTDTGTGTQPGTGGGTTTPTTGAIPFAGVNLAAWANAPHILPGEDGTHYRSPVYVGQGDDGEAIIKKWVGDRGVRLVRLPILLGRSIQMGMDGGPAAGGDLDTTFVEKTQKTLDLIAKYSNGEAKVIFDLHNFMRYFRFEKDANGTLTGRLFSAAEAAGKTNCKRTQQVLIGAEKNADGSDRWGAVHLANFLQKLASRFPVFGYCPMNEPYSNGEGTDINVSGMADLYINTMNVVLKNLRNTTKAPVFLNGLQWASTRNFGTTSARLVKEIVDPANNIIWEGHAYPDYDGGSSGQFTSNNDKIPVDMLANHINAGADYWKANAMRGFIGEAGAPPTAAGWAALIKGLDTAYARGIPVTLWIAGQGMGGEKMWLDDSAQAGLVEKLIPYFSKTLPSWKAPL